ncbi:YihY/virulence factor BrkB family protein [Paraflavitalea sp. CAU 1676]|uniref:YihY/virulence factor BrkB family protein n=1 Tax=Paraflavitalea sp. CAU 1676 TaxID=3032598 RepID=UPI0023D9C0B2|nr:YihY/virulence factor BrkB family protein [Paraflavitalea sp. CAU 1676]MDF2189477.1 YihY/virulence factor BrkB family protein [Paraflavitalea sp. CAU 1676]
MRKFFKLLELLRSAFREFNKNEPLRLAAATAFFTTFALPAILIILIQLFGFIVGRRTIGRQLFTGLTDILGPNAVEEMRATLRNVRQLTQSWYIAAAVFIFLLFVATTLFKVIRDSLNQLWGIKVKEGTGIGFQLRQRGRSFIVILFAGILFLAVLLAEGTLTLLPEKADLLIRILKQLVSIIAATAWFTIVFKYIADGYTQWKVTLAGAFFTGLLFTIGKMILGLLLSYSTIKNIYATSTSFVLLLLFVFYCSFMFYYGACFLKVWAQHKQQPIIPHSHAIKYKLAVVE